MTRLIALLSVMMMFSSITLAQDTKPVEKNDAKKTEAFDKAETEHNLKPIFSKGDRNRYLSTQITKTEQTINGQDMGLESNVKSDSLMEVKDIDDKGSAVVEMTYERIRYTSKQQGTETKYDSKTDKLDEVPDAVKPVALMKDIKFKVTYDKDGQVKKIGGGKEYFDTIREEMGDLYADAFEKMGMDALLGESLKQSGRAIPSGEVSVKDTWSNKWELKNPLIGQYNYDTTYSFAAIEEKNGHKCAKITSTTDISLDKDVKGQFDTKIKSCDATGTIWIDLETRLAVHSEAKVVLEIEMTVSGMAFTTKTTTTSTTELKDEKAIGDEETKKDEKTDDKEE